MAELAWQGKHKPLISTLPPSSLYTEKCYTATSHESQQEKQLADNIWHNALILGDRYNVLLKLLENHESSVSLIYIDPPFMTGRIFSSGHQIAYNDQWETIDAYLQWLYETFILLHMLLADTGSAFIHLDWRTTHYAKLLLDEVFQSSEKGKHGGGFQNEIIWHYQSGGRSTRHYARKHDTILWYTKSAHFCFHPERIGEQRGKQKRNHMRREIAVDGRVTWTIRSAGRLYTYDEETLLTPSDVWADLPHLHQKDPERTGYATQKPLSLLERILLASSEEDDLILDCFCGSGVTPVAAERLGRRWLVCDQSELAIQTTLARLLAEERQYPFLLQQLIREAYT